MWINLATYRLQLPILASNLCIRELSIFLTGVSNICTLLFVKKRGVTPVFTASGPKARKEGPS